MADTRVAISPPKSPTKRVTVSAPRSGGSRGSNGRRSQTPGSGKHAPSPDYSRPIVRSAVRRWKRLHEQSMMEKLVGIRNEKKNFVKNSRDDARKIARKIPTELLAREWLNDNEATLEVRAYLVDRVLPTLILGVEKLLNEVDKQELADQEDGDPNFNPINFLAQYLMRNNPRYSNFSEASPYVRGLREVSEELRRQLFNIEDNREQSSASATKCVEQLNRREKDNVGNQIDVWNQLKAETGLQANAQVVKFLFERLARIKAEAKRRREERDRQEQLRQAEQDRREKAFINQFVEWNVGPSDQVELSLVQNALRSFAEIAESYPEELQDAAKLSHALEPTDESGKMLSAKEFAKYLAKFVSDLSTEMFDQFMMHLAKCAVAHRNASYREDRRIVLTNLFLTCDHSGIGQLDRHRILNLFETLWESVKEDVKKTLRNPRRWPVVEVDEVEDDFFSDEDEPIELQTQKQETQQEQTEQKESTVQEQTEESKDEKTEQKVDETSEQKEETTTEQKVDAAPSSDKQEEDKDKTEKPESSEQKEEVAKEEVKQEVKESAPSDVDESKSYADVTKVGEKAEEPKQESSEEKKEDEKQEEQKDEGQKEEAKTEEKPEEQKEESKTEDKKVEDKTEEQKEESKTEDKKVEDKTDELPKDDSKEEKPETDKQDEKPQTDKPDEKPQTDKPDEKPVEKEQEAKTEEKVEPKTEEKKEEGEKTEEPVKEADKQEESSQEKTEEVTKEEGEGEKKEEQLEKKEEQSPEQETTEAKGETDADKKEDTQKETSEPQAGGTEEAPATRETDRASVSFAQGTSFERQKTAVTVHSQSQSIASAFDESSLNVSQFVQLTETFLGEEPTKVAFDSIVKFVKEGYEETEEEKLQRLKKARKEALSIQRKQMMDQLFEKWDNDGSGFLDLDEVETVMMKYKEGQETEAIQKAKIKLKKQPKYSQDNRLSKREFRQFIQMVLDEINIADAFDYFIEFLTNSVERSYAERVRGEARKKWLQHVVVSAETGAASMEPVYKSVFQALYKDAEAHGNGKRISANISMLERNNIEPERGDVCLRYVAATVDDADFLLGKILFKDMRNISFASIESGKPIHVPRVANHGKIQFWNPYRLPEDREGSFIVVPLKDKRKRVFGLMGIDTLNDRHTKTIFITHEIQYFQGVAKAFSISYHLIDMRKKLLRITESAVSWIHRRSPHVHEIITYMVEPDGKDKDYVLRKMMYTDERGNVHNLTNPPRLERKDNLFRDYLFKCVDNSETVSADAYGQRHLAFPLRDDGGKAVAIVDISIGELKKLPAHENKEVQRMLRLLQQAHKEITREFAGEDKLMVLEAEKDDDGRMDIMFDRLMLMELRENVAKIDTKAFAELRSYNEPPKIINDIVKAVCAIFHLDKIESGEMGDWTSLRSILTNELLQKMTEYDPTSSANHELIPPEKIEKYLRDVPHGEVAKFGSLPAQNMYNWVFVCISLIEHTLKMRQNENEVPKVSNGEETERTQESTVAS